MKIILNKKKLVKFIHREKSLGFVPTMGALHKGHISLIKKSITQCNKTVVSIFINKAQFNEESDFNKYPRLIKRDIALLRRLKVDYLFIPSNKQIYPSGANKKIKINSFYKKLCGKFRPNHFKAVVDVIDRFANIIKPNKIFLGEKDMQQLKIIDNFIRKKHKKIKIIGCKTIREKNGIAYSSRNLSLSKNEKKIASQIYKLILSIKFHILKKRIKIKDLKVKILKLGAKKIDYLEIININKVIKPFKKKNKFRIFIAYYIGSVRMIDNI